MKIVEVSVICILLISVCVLAEDLPDCQKSIFDVDLRSIASRVDITLAVFYPWTLRYYLRLRSFLTPYLKPLWNKSFSKTIYETYENNAGDQEIRLDQINLNRTPDEIKVKTAGRLVVIEVKHGEKMEEYIIRTYTLPPGTEPGVVLTKLSKEGVLTISAKKKKF